jgi:hypothetical protein
MFLPLYPLRIVTVSGLNESDLGDPVRHAAKSLNVEVQDDPAPQRNVFIRSDQYSFIRRGVPSLMMAFGNKKGSQEEQIEEGWLKNRCHAPSNDLNQPVDLQAAGEFNRLTMRLAENVANHPNDFTSEVCKPYHSVAERRHPGVTRNAIGRARTRRAYWSGGGPSLLSVNRSARRKYSSSLDGDCLKVSGVG